MILFLIVAILVMADAILTHWAVNKFGIKIEGNPIMKTLMKIGYEYIYLLTILYIGAVYMAYDSDVMGFWGWFVNIACWGSLLICNLYILRKWYRKYK